MLDLWIHVGDFIYEYGPKRYPAKSKRMAADSALDPPHELVTLADYRARYALYMTDQWGSKLAEAGADGGDMGRPRAC